MSYTQFVGSVLAIAASALVWSYLRRRQRKFPVKIPTWMFIEMIANRRDRHPSYGIMEINAALGSPPLLMAERLFGLIRMVWITDFDTMKEYMFQNQKATSDRWSSTIVEETEGHLAIISAPSNAVSARRKLILRAFRNIGLGKSHLEKQVSLEAKKLVDFIEHDGNLQCTEFSRELMRATANIIFGLVLGKRFEYDDERLSELLTNLKTVLQQPLVGSTAVLSSRVPRWIRLLAGRFDDGGAAWIKSYNEIKAFGDGEIQEHRENPEIQGTIIRACLDMQEKNPAEFTDGVIKGILTDLLIAGTDTSSNTLEYCVLNLALHVELQEHIHQELCEELQSDLSDLSMENVDRIPLTMAFIHETMRFTPVATGTIPHVSKTDVHLKCGIVVPAGCLVIGSQIAVMRTDHRWRNPSQFDVCNFLTDDGKFHKPEMFVPFGIGPRSCIGEKLAKLEILMFLTHMIKKFKFLPLEGEEYDGNVGAYSLVMRPKPYKITTVVRN